MADDANPARGAESPHSLREAATRIKAAMQAQEAQAKPPDQPAKEANAEPETEAKPKAAKVEESEPEAERKPEPEQGEAEAEESDTKEAEQETEELADTVEGLAEQLGIKPEDLISVLTAEVKVNGESQRVNLKEALAGYQRDSDYRNKTKDAAEKVRQADEAARQASLERQHYTQNLVPLMQQLQAAIQDESRDLQALLDQGDLLGYQRLQNRLAQRYAMLQQAQQEAATAHQRQQSESEAKRKEAIAENERILLDKFPAWRDLDKGRAEMRELRQVAKDYGVPEKVADTFYQASFFEMMRDLREFKRIKSGKAETLKKVSALPHVQKAGAAKPSVKPEVQKLRVAKDRLRKTGNIRDAGAALGLALRQRGVL